MKKRILALAAVLALAITGVAVASVTFDPATGTGFVGKGDVQTALGWNNQKLQQNAFSLSFTYNTSDNYDAVCTWVTGEGTRGEQTHNVTHSTSTVVNDTVAYDPRVRTQVTGFNLTGFGATTSTGEIPVVGGACPGNEGTDGTWTSVTLVSSTGGLYVNGVLLS